MAELSVTAGSVLAATDATTNTGITWGETITAGMAVYKKTSDGYYYKAQNDGSAAESGSAGLGIALNGGSAGQPGAIITKGNCTIGATVASAVTYCVGATAGAICPDADVGSGKYKSVLGTAISTTVIYVNPVVAGVVV